MLPSELAVVKVKGHASGDEPDAVGNRNADEMAISSLSVIMKGYHVAQARPEDKVTTNPNVM